jgi:hypothetical protein
MTRRHLDLLPQRPGTRKRTVYACAHVAAADAKVALVATSDVLGLEPRRSLVLCAACDVAPAPGRDVEIVVVPLVAGSAPDRAIELAAHECTCCGREADA